LNSAANVSQFLGRPRVAAGPVQDIGDGALFLTHWTDESFPGLDPGLFYVGFRLPLDPI
jgi:hypothetical protein